MEPVSESPGRSAHAGDGGTSFVPLYRQLRPPRSPSDYGPALFGRRLGQSIQMGVTSLANLSTPVKDRRTGRVTYTYPAAFRS